MTTFNDQIDIGIDDNEMIHRLESGTMKRGRRFQPTREMITQVSLMVTSAKTMGIPVGILSWDCSFVISDNK
jgi:hypothetical protein